MAKKISELSLLDIIPSSIADDPQVNSMIPGLDPELQSVSRDIREALIYSRIDELPEEIIDLLAWQWHVDFYDLARTLEMKRETVKGSIAWHRKKGTVWAIKKALGMLGIEAEITEWWKIPGAIPYTFEVEAELTDKYWSIFPNTQDATKVIRAAIMESKSTRSWLANLKTLIKNDIPGFLYIGAATITAASQKIHPEAPSTGPSVLTTGAANFLSGKKTLGLPLPRVKPANTGAGIAVVLASIIRVGRLNEPRPFMEVWPQFVKAGIASFSGGRIKINPSVPQSSGYMYAGMATHMTSFITITQEAI
jgi:phage tail P2-like protein